MTSLFSCESTSSCFLQIAIHIIVLRLSLLRYPLTTITLLVIISSLIKWLLSIHVYKKQVHIPTWRHFLGIQENFWWLNMFPTYLKHVFSQGLHWFSLCPTWGSCARSKWRSSSQAAEDKEAEEEWCIFVAHSGDSAADKSLVCCQAGRRAAREHHAAGFPQI